MAGNPFHNRGPSQLPGWDTLADGGSAASEDDILESSQDMRDELVDSSPPRSRAGSAQPRKRTADYSISAPLGGNARKRRKTDAGGVVVGPAGKDSDDKPASAHARPRIPATRPASSVLNPSTPKSDLAARMAQFEQRRGAMPVASSSTAPPVKNTPDLTQRFKTMNVARKKNVGRPKGKGGLDPRQSTLNFPSSPTKSPQKARGNKASGDRSSSDLEEFPDSRKIAADKMKSSSAPSLARKSGRPSLPERPKATSKNVTIWSLDSDEGDNEPPRSPQITRLVGQIRPKKIESRGGEDDPIIVSDDEDPVAPPGGRNVQISPEPMAVPDEAPTDVPMSPVDGMHDDPPSQDEQDARSISPPPPVPVSPRVPPQPVASTSRAQLPTAPAPRPSAVLTPSSSTSSVSAAAPVVGTLIPRQIPPQQSSRGRGFFKAYKSAYQHQFPKLDVRHTSSKTDSGQPANRSSPIASGSKAPLRIIDKTPSPTSSGNTSNADASSAQESMPDPVPDSEAPSSRVTSKSASVDPDHASETEERTQRVPMSVGKSGQRRPRVPPIQPAAAARAGSSSSSSSPITNPIPKSLAKPAMSQLDKRIEEVRRSHAELTGDFIDLTGLSDTEASDMVVEDREDSPEAIEEALRLAEVAPYLMDLDEIGPVTRNSPSSPQDPVQADVPLAQAAPAPATAATLTPLDLVRKVIAEKATRRVEPTPMVPLPRPAVKAAVPVLQQDPDSEEEEVSMILEARETSKGEDEEDEEEEPVVDIRSRLRSARQVELPPPPTWSSDSSDSEAPRAPRRPPPRAGPTELLVPKLKDIHLGEDDLPPGCQEFTWEKNGRKWAYEYASTYMRARDLDFNLQNRMNALSIDARRGDDMQKRVFESIISVGTADDEPYAPRIEIHNKIDDELSPPFEFYYTNRMWHSDAVPPPDVDNLVGCDCIGRCDPNNKQCACVQRQAKHLPPGLTGFAYDKRGRIREKMHAAPLPIFECNAMCACDDDDCQNRVVQQGRKVYINIEKTATKGWGVFAGKKIPAHSFVGIYAGEYLTNEEGNERGLVYDEFGRTYLFDIDFYWMKKSYGKPESEQNEDDDDDPVKYCVDAYHAGNFTRYLNHSCDPNCNIAPVYINDSNPDKPLLTIFTVRDVAAGEELCFSYFGERDEEDIQEEEEMVAKGAVHVRCQCGAANCTGRMWK